MTELMQKTEEAVRKAGKLFFDLTMGSQVFTKEGSANFVTQVDYEVQSFMQKRLAEILPGSNIISEESEENLLSLEKPTWVLDPVDGTTNLMYRCRMSAVSLGLYIENKPVAGFILNPFNDEMFMAEAGKGAYLNGKRISVTSNTNISDCLLGFGTTPYDRVKTRKTFEITEKVFMKCRDIRRTGSSALDIAYVACGRLDGFFEMTLQPWDYAAGFIILKEAGGTITNWCGEELDIISPSPVVTSNGHIHNELVQLLQD